MPVTLSDEQVEALKEMLKNVSLHPYEMSPSLSGAFSALGLKAVVRPQTRRPRLLKN